MPPVAASATTTKPEGRGIGILMNSVYQYMDNPKPPSLSGELWREIPGMGGDYWASSLGRIWSRPRTRTVGGLMKFHLDADGYNHVALSRKRKSANRTTAVHVLVTVTFVGPRPPGLVSRHLDGNKTNCRSDNLTWGTISENCLDMVTHGVHPSMVRTHCPHGHEYTPESTSYSKPAEKYGRYCRTCKLARLKEYKQRRKLARQAA